jgi:tungstate transport system substrate-binding protein
MKRILPKIASIVLVLILLVTALGCPPPDQQLPPPPPAAPLRLATTTSLYDTGLWHALEIIFEERYDVDLHITSVGTGRALELGRAGDVDVVAVHDPVQEAAFIAGGYALNATVNGTLMERVPWGYNYFIIVGPKTDPAGIGDLTGGRAPEEAFRIIQRQGAIDPRTVRFVSRGDRSGTHGREMAIWTSAGYNYTADIQGTGRTAGWYIETGAAMGATLVTTNEKMAYTLSDKGTFLAFQGLGRVPELVILVEEGDIMLNVYTVMICKKGVNPVMAQNLVTFLREPEIQALIAGFGVPTFGEPLFFPLPIPQ